MVISRSPVWTGLLLLVVLGSALPAIAGDTTFRQAVSVKYETPGELRGVALKKVVVDYNQVVHLLTGRGVYRVVEGELVKDNRYRPLAGRVPRDITVQEGSRRVYYLYEKEFLSNGDAGRPYGSFPAGAYSRIAVSEDGTVLLAGERSVAIFENGRLKKLGETGEPLLSVHVHQGVFYGLSPVALYRFSKTDVQAIHRYAGMRAVTFRGDDAVIGCDSGYYSIATSTGNLRLPMQRKVPVQQLTALTMAGPVLWAGTSRGAFREAAGGSGYRYYASKRWLNDDRVIDLAAGPDDAVYVLTAGGLAQIRFLQQTLADKAAYFQRKIRQRHIRYGFISLVHLPVPGDIRTAELVDTDNDGLWSAFYLGSQAFRYAVSGAPEAKRYAWETFQAYERLLSVNQLRGFPSRTFERKGFKSSDPERWRDSPDPEWEWKGHTSSDEFVGYIFVSAVLDQLLTGTAEEKQRVAAFIDNILTHIIENNYQLVDVDGKPTLWGRWNPEYINWYPRTIVDRKLGSVTIIAGLQLGYALTGKELYKSEMLRLINEHGYLENMLTGMDSIGMTPGYVYQGNDMGMGGWNHSDDEMAFLSYWVLYHYALNDTLRTHYARIIRDHWEIERPERNALWNMIALGTEGSFDRGAAMWHLREFPMDLVRWTVHNSHRKDITFQEPGFRRQFTSELLPPGERPVHRHNANPFEPDGGNGGHSELAGDEFLLPYWMGRYLGVYGAPDTTAESAAPVQKRAPASPVQPGAATAPGAGKPAAQDLGVAHVELREGENKAGSFSGPERFFNIE